MKLHLYSIVLLISILSCKRSTDKKNITNDRVKIDSISRIEKLEGEQIIKIFKIPNTFREKEDVLSDSLFIDLPSEGTVVKIFNKRTHEKLYVSNSIATMNKYYSEVYTKKDSIFILRKVKNYNQPLTILGAEIESENNEYTSYFKDKIISFVRNDTVIENLKEITKKDREFQDLKEIILSTER